MKTDKFKNKSRTMSLATRTVNYTATMESELLTDLDKLDGSRSGKISAAVKSYYKL